MTVPGDGALYIYENVGVGGLPQEGGLYVYENVGIAGLPQDGALYAYENVGVASAPANGALYVYENVLGDSNTKFFVFQLRADTASGTADTTTVNVKWVVGGVTTDLGNFTSFAASPTGDAPWRNVVVPVDAVYDNTKTNRAEIRMGVETSIPRTVGSGWNSYASDQFEEQSTTLVRTDAAHTWRLYSSSGSWGYGVWRTSTALQPGKTYRVGYWMRDVQPWTGRITFLEIQGAYQIMVDSSTDVNTSTWTLVSGLVTVPSDWASGPDLVVQTYRGGTIAEGNFETFIADWFTSEIVNEVPETSVDNAHIRNVWLELPDTDPMYGQYPLGHDYVEDVEDGYVKVLPSTPLPWTVPGTGTYTYTFTGTDLHSGWMYALKAYFPSGASTSAGSYGAATSTTVTAGVTYAAGLTGTPITKYEVIGAAPGDSALVRYTLYPTDVLGPIMNDGGTLPSSAYYVEQGPSVPASPYNYSVNFGPAGGAGGPSPPAGTALNGWNGWSCDPEWHFDGGFGVVLESHSTGYDGVFNAHGHSLVLRSDGLHSAPKHSMQVYMSYYGSRGSNGEGAVWGYKDANNYWFAIPNSDSGPGEIGYISGGVKTVVSPLPRDSWVDLTINHDFRTGALTVHAYEPFLGDTYDYAGTHPWSVVNGKVGFLGKHQNGGAFWTAALIGNFSLSFGSGSIAYSKQYSMQTNSVVNQEPATWYFRATKIAKWVVGAASW